MKIKSCDSEITYCMEHLVSVMTVEWKHGYTWKQLFK